MREKKACSAEGCEKQATSKGLCRNHYAQDLRKRKKEQAPSVDTAPMRLQGPVSTEKLEEFRYTANEADLQYWEGNPEASPLNVPKAIRDKYPNMDFHWCSEKKWDKLGKNYQGWQKFTDNKHPEGMKRGNDLFLAAMPKERAQRYRDHVAEQSIERLRSAQSKALQSQVGSVMNSKELEEMGAQGATPGLLIGQRPRTRTQFGNKTITGGGFVRGMKRSEVAEIVRKEIADRRKNRTYSFASK